MRLLALDLATKTGWAVGEDGVLIDSGTFKAAQKNGTTGDTFYNAYNWLNKTITDYEIKAVIYEKSFMAAGRNKNTGLLLNGLIAITELVCVDRDIAYAIVPHPTWKKYTTGKGNSDKQHTIATINRMYGVHLGMANNDEADAIGVLTWAFGNVV